jgi:hypothetical protein
LERGGDVEVACSGDWTLARGVPMLDKVGAALDGQGGSVRMIARELGEWDAALVAFGLSVARLAEARGTFSTWRAPFRRAAKARRRAARACRLLRRSWASRSSRRSPSSAR